MLVYSAVQFNQSDKCGWSFKWFQTVDCSIFFIPSLHSLRQGYQMLFVGSVAATPPGPIALIAIEITDVLIPHIFSN